MTVEALSVFQPPLTDLFGLKPTRGRIPVGPSSFRGWQGASVQFALTKTVRDTKRLLYHMQTCQMESPFILPKLSKVSLEEAVRPLKNCFFDCFSYWW